MSIELLAVIYQVKNGTPRVNIGSNKIDIKKKYIVEKSQILAKFKK